MMDTRQKQMLGGGLLLAAGALFAKETFAWALGKALDLLANPTRSGRWVVSDLPWLDAIGVVLFVAGGFLLFSAFRTGRLAQRIQPQRAPTAAIDIDTTSDPQDTFSNGACGDARTQPKPLNDTDGIYEGVHNVLLSFVVDHVIGTCSEQLTLQSAIIGELTDNPTLAVLAEYGASHNYDNSEFTASLERLMALCSSPPAFIPFQEMEACVQAVEAGYKKFCSQTDELAASGGIDYRTHDRLQLQWAIWARRHNQMIYAYEAIKRESRFKLLFRPVRMSRWGPAVVLPSPL